MSCKTEYNRDTCVRIYTYDRTATREEKARFWDELDKSKDNALYEFKKKYPSEFDDMYMAKFGKYPEGAVPPGRGIKNAEEFMKQQKKDFCKRYGIKTENLQNTVFFGNLPSYKHLKH